MQQPPAQPMVPPLPQNYRQVPPPGYPGMPPQLSVNASEFVPQRFPPRHNRPSHNNHSHSQVTHSEILFFTIRIDTCISLKDHIWYKTMCLLRICSKIVILLYESALKMTKYVDFQFLT